MCWRLYTRKNHLRGENHINWCKFWLALFTKKYVKDSITNWKFYGWMFSVIWELYLQHRNTRIFGEIDWDYPVIKIKLINIIIIQNENKTEKSFSSIGYAINDKPMTELWQFDICCSKLDKKVASFWEYIENKNVV